MCENVATARYLLEVGNGTFVILLHHLADTHLIVGFARNTVCEIALVKLVIFKGFVVILLLEIGIGYDLGHLRLAFFVGLLDIERTVFNHRIIVAVHVVNLHDVGWHHLGKFGMRTQTKEALQGIVVFFSNILDMCIIIPRRILIFAFIQHQAVEKRQGLIQVARLEISISHVELHLLRLVGG